MVSGTKFIFNLKILETRSKRVFIKTNEEMEDGHHFQQASMLFHKYV